MHYSTVLFRVVAYITISALTHSMRIYIYIIYNCLGASHHIHQALQLVITVAP